MDMAPNAIDSGLTVAERNWMEIQRLVNARGVIDQTIKMLGDCADAPAAAKLLDRTRSYLVGMLTDDGQGGGAK